jgi:signal transduction histidine kinase
VPAALSEHVGQTPLAAIQGFIELAHHNIQWALSQDRALAGEVTARCSATNDILGRAEQRIGHLTRLMNDLLDDSRVQGVAVQDKTRGAGGSLGLYISRTIVEQHGGRVGVESTPGSGSTFWFALPLSP